MPIPVVVPRLGWTMEQGVFVEWLKRDGELIQIGEPVFVLEGEKATQDIESTDAGTLKIPANSPKPGDTVSVGATVGYLLAAGEVWNAESVETAATASVGNHSDVNIAAAGRSSDDAADLAVPVVSIVDAEIGIPLEETKPDATISPRALRVALELGVDWTTVTGTGSSGRIRESDIRAVRDKRKATTGKCADSSPACSVSTISDATAPVAANAERKPASNIRSIIAARMLASAQSTAAVTLTTHLDASHLVALRKQFKVAAAEGEVIPSFTDILVKLVAVALKQHPEVNSIMDERGMIVANDETHIGIAVDTAAGLLVPVLRSVGRLTLRQVAVRTRDLIDRTRQRSLSAFELQGGTFTVTNLGMYCVDSFTPLLNPPQAAILGVGRITREPAVVEDQIVIRDRLTLSLTFDHRIIDGAPAARFLDCLAKLIANPAPALIG
ncbi:MAG: 2-oxo acid dehydrogenase subunit [Planctomycetaceae bacterium]|nr:2-oxo acid dehydrogenase subunit [Planctomycetaceae bacterium]